MTMPAIRSCPSTGSARGVRGLLAVTVLLGACWSVPEVDRQIIKPWLDCVDCTSDQLNRVVATGPRLVPYLESALRDGPLPTDTSLARQRAVQAVARAMRYRQRHGPPVAMTQDESLRVVTGQLDEFRLNYRLRAAQALFRLDSARASQLVAEFCASGPAELQRHPGYKTSFNRVGACP